MTKHLNKTIEFFFKLIGGRKKQVSICVTREYETHERVLVPPTCARGTKPCTINGLCTGS